ncbi:RNB domain-containing ribonuclease [Streptomyces flavofungini]|uniref:RNB domain-containing ribonuclease n=1 Tax=Streptomyces flavofungini TaxID=68200 RepID=A0ABS0XIX8_9ACTN|nr:RNB domain-containing ribonuclease [Streptomyces flavofungini]MBJ3813178.1 RNB domain-containing ribonuclease [Streptomyces flavofungini]GHC40526.1 ribonuclease R [Streptomyces flavofungini]
MPRRHLHVTGAAEAPLRAALRALRAELDVPEAFAADVLAEAERAAAAPRLPAEDATGVPFFTVDPPTSVDLDQAMHLSRRAGGGFRVRYAIADVAAYVTPGGPLDATAHRRVTTLYFPDGKVPLHPTPLSEGAASLLPDQTCPAVLWTLDLDAEGRTARTDVRRALVRSRAKLDYEGVQRAIDAGTAEEPVALLADIGRLREQREAERGGISLNVPEQEVTEQDGTYALGFRAPLPADGWNAQISLLTGMAAADLMIASGTGVLRTLPLAPDGAVTRLRHTAKALGIDWPHHVPYAGLVRSLDPRDPHHAAFLQECTTLLRGAGYTAFSGGEVPELTTHAAVAAPYAHCTAPLRRLVDRYAAELCLAACAGAEPPDWVLAALPELPREMADGTRRANAVERGCVDIVEAALLKDRVGEVFDGVVVDVKEREPGVGTVQLAEPAVVARIEAGPGGAGGSAGLPLGERLRVRLTQADPGRAKVLFAPA